MIAKLIKGKGFRGALEYDLQKQKGYILDSNMAGGNPRELAKEFGVVRALRPNLGKAVCHVSISIGPDEQLSDDQWREVAQEYLQGMGYEDSQYVVTRHTDTEHPHIHILVNRISVNGEVVSDSHDYKRQETIMRQMEHSYGLKSVELNREIKRKSLTKGEIEHVLRTREPSVRMKLQNIVDNCMKMRPSLDVFVEKLGKEGVEVKLNQASTGRISGISFCLNGVAMKGSDLGKSYTWNSLMKRGLNHEIGQSKKFELGREPKGDEHEKRFERGRTAGNASGAYEATRRVEDAEQRRIAENFERLAEEHKRLSGGRSESCERSKGLSR